MSETGSSVVTDALTEIKVQPLEQPVQPANMQTGIRTLNRLMNALDARGIKLGYTNITNPGDFISVDAGAIEGMIANLSISLASIYQKPVSEALAKRAKDGMTAMRQLGVKIEESGYGGTLPIGSGNQETQGFLTDPYYAPVVQVESRITLTANTTNTVIATAGTAVLVAGAWVEKTALRVVTTAAGRITLEQDDEVDIAANVLINPVSGSVDLGLYIAINGVVRPTSFRKTFSDSQVYLSTTLIDKLFEDDYIELYVSNETNTTDLLVVDSQICVND